MTNTRSLTGWIRLWIVFSAIWIGGFCAAAWFEVRQISTTNNLHGSVHRQDFIEQLPEEMRGLLLWDQRVGVFSGQETLSIIESDTREGATAISFIPFRSGVSDQQASRLRAAYDKVADQAYRASTIRYALYQKLLSAISAPILLLIVFWVGRWVVRGFRSRAL